MKDIAEKKQQAMVREHTQRETLHQKNEQERNKLFEHHFIATYEELRHALVAIDLKNLSAEKKEAKKH